MGGPNEYEDDFENDSSSSKKTAPPAPAAPPGQAQPLHAPIPGPTIPIPAAPGNVAPSSIPQSQPASYPPQPQPRPQQYTQQQQPVAALGMPQTSPQQPAQYQPPVATSNYVGAQVPQPLPQQQQQQPAAALGMPQQPPLAPSTQMQPNTQPPTVQQPQSSYQPIAPLGMNQPPTGAAASQAYQYTQYAQQQQPVAALGMPQTSPQQPAQYQPPVATSNYAGAQVPQPLPQQQQQQPAAALGMPQLPPASQVQPLPQPQPGADQPSNPYQLRAQQQYQYPPAAYAQAVPPGAYDPTAQQPQQPPVTLTDQALPSGQVPGPTQPPSEELKAYVVASSGGDLRFRFAGVDMVRHERRKPKQDATFSPSKNEKKQASSRSGYAAREVRVWQTFREKQPAATASPTKANLKAQGALVVVPTQIADVQAMRAYDESHGGVAASFTSDDLLTAAFAQPPEVLSKMVQRLKDEASHLPTEELRRHRFVDALNQAGLVAYHHRFLGVKRVKESYALGLGAKATALQFAVLAGRLDNVLTLIQAGGSTVDNVATARRIAAANNFAAIEELLKTAKGGEKQMEGRKSRVKSRTGTNLDEHAVPDPA